jgi:hypothetical protein
MAVAYALAAWMVFAVRDAMFRDRPLTQALLTAGFCAAAHVQWLTYQALLAAGSVGWSQYGLHLLQALLLSGYTALLAPLLHVLMRRPAEWIVPAPASRWR